jgi:hypothetical protein
MYRYLEVAASYCPMFAGCTDIQKRLYYSHFCLQDVLISGRGCIILPEVYRMYRYPGMAAS